MACILGILSCCVLRRRRFGPPDSMWAWRRARASPPDLFGSLAGNHHRGTMHSRQCSSLRPVRRCRRPRRVRGGRADPRAFPAGLGGRDARRLDGLRKPPCRDACPAAEVVACRSGPRGWREAASRRISALRTWPHRVPFRPATRFSQNTDEPAGWPAAPNRPGTQRPRWLDAPSRRGTSGRCRQNASPRRPRTRHRKESVGMAHHHRRHSAARMRLLPGACARRA